MAATYPDELALAVEGYLESLRFADEAGLTAGLEEAMRYSLLAGGKRIRPVLALATARALGPAQPARAQDGAADRGLGRVRTPPGGSRATCDNPFPRICGRVGRPLPDRRRHPRCDGYGRRTRQAPGVGRAARQAHVRLGARA